MRKTGAPENRSHGDKEAWEMENSLSEGFRRQRSVSVDDDGDFEQFFPEKRSIGGIRGDLLCGGGGAAVGPTERNLAAFPHRRSVLRQLRFW